MSVSTTPDAAGPESGAAPASAAHAPSVPASLSPVARALLEALSAQPYTFDFFRAVRLLQCAFADRPRIGSSRSPEEDPVRFGQRPSLAFAPSTLDGLQPGPRPRLYVNFFGLFGPTGPLPLHLTDYAIRRQLGQKAETGHEEGRDQRAERASSRTELPSSRKDYTLSAFLDVFHHRLISLFFLAWARNQQVVDFDRPKGQRFPFYLGTFFGLGNEANEHGEFEPFEDALPAWAKLYYAGHLACPTRHAEGLRSVIEDYFGVATRAETFRGRWLDLPPENQCRLGGSPEAGCLGLSVVAGARIWDSQLSFRLRLGPMSFRDFQRFLPGSRSLQRLSSWVTNYVGTQYFWDLQLVLKAEEVPETVLRRDRPPQAGRLGWTIWLKSQPMARDSEDLVLNPGS